MKPFSQIVIKHLTPILLKIFYKKLEKETTTDTHMDLKTH